MGWVIRENAASPPLEPSGTLDLDETPPACQTSCEAEEPLQSVAIPARLAARIDEVPDEEKKAWQLPIRPL